MKITSSISATKTALRQIRKGNKSIALVPTMGCLHEGHISLIKKARTLADRVVVSIFVNPTQFGPKEDFKHYPRPSARDKKICRENGVDLVFMPAAHNMYPDGFSTYVEEETLSKVLCGKSRPGHFRGVTTVVLKLFNIIAPDTAVFGQKDYQQLQVIKKMTTDLNLGVKICAASIVRAQSGLALSSRNAYMTDEETQDANRINLFLKEAKKAAKEGRTNTAEIAKSIRGKLKRLPRCSKIDYIEIRDSKSLEPLKQIQPKNKSAVLAVAVYIGRTRLIDNILLP